MPTGQNDFSAMKIAGRKVETRNVTRLNLRQGIVLILLLLVATSNLRVQSDELREHLVLERNVSFKRRNEDSSENSNQGFSFGGKYIYSEVLKSQSHVHNRRN